MVLNIKLLVKCLIKLIRIIYTLKKKKFKKQGLTKNKKGQKIISRKVISSCQKKSHFKIYLILNKIL